MTLQKYEATDAEVGQIISTLSDARQRLHSENFLDETEPGAGDGFPWNFVKWYKLAGEDVACTSWLAKLYLFWDGVAWGESRDVPPRKLKPGVEGFKRIAMDILQYPFEGCVVHLADILQKQESYRQSQSGEAKPFLMLAGRDIQDIEEGRLIIIDGNHRAVAAYWWAMESQSNDHLPRSAWLGLSDKMALYYQYQKYFSSMERSDFIGHSDSR